MEPTDITMVIIERLRRRGKSEKNGREKTEKMRRKKKEEFER